MDDFDKICHVWGYQNCIFWMVSLAVSSCVCGNQSRKYFSKKIGRFTSMLVDLKRYFKLNHEVYLHVTKCVERNHNIVTSEK